MERRAPARGEAIETRRVLAVRGRGQKRWLGLLLMGLACGAPEAEARGEPLYFALEVRSEGRLVARPKLLGEEGRTVRAERRQPGAAEPDYRLVLVPRAEGSGYRLELDLKLPQGPLWHEGVSLLHGQQRKVYFKDRELEVSLLLMRVDSPEFRALMDLSPQQQATGGSGPAI
jgi:hypothetical protein